jgi:hypothetical protein
MAQKDADMSDCPVLSPEQLHAWLRFRERHERKRNRLLAELRAENAKLKAELALAPPRQEQCKAAGA